MTAGATDTSYVAARIHARHGSRADARDRARLAAYEDVRGYLQAAHGTPLGTFLGDLSGDADIHAIEGCLRQAWRDYVAEVASWHGPEFDAAFGHLADLPDLPARACLARGDAPPAWLDPPQMPDGLPVDAETLRAAFLAALPSRRDRDAASKAIAALADAGDGEGDPPAADALREAAERLFRRETRPFARVLAHLATIAADLAEMRGELAVRCVLPTARPPVEAP